MKQYIKLAAALQMALRIARCEAEGYAIVGMSLEELVRQEQAHYNEEKHTLTLNAGTLLYKVADLDRIDEKMSSDFTWFSFVDTYDTDGTYGDYLFTYRLTRDVTLINIGTNAAIDSLAPGLNLSRNPLLSGEMYSGAGPNKAAHAELMYYIKSNYLNGTFIYDAEDADMSGTHFYSSADEDRDGPSEVVLYGAQALLESVSVVRIR